MRENLLGFLMGALDEAERAEVQAALEADPDLAAECARLEQTIAPFSEDEAWIDPPRRLADRTISFVEAYAEKETADQHAADQHSAEQHASNAEFSLERRMSSLDELLVEDSDEHSKRTVLSASQERPASGSRRWTLADATVAIGICIAAAILFIPAIANSQRQAAITQCQNNLRQLGHALVSYSYNNHGQFPFVPSSGKLGIAGIYAPILKEAGHTEDDQVFLCPSSSLAQEANTFAVPRTDQLLQQDGKQLVATQRKLGGSFGYAFGYEDEGSEYRPNVNRSRPRFALLADSPSLHLKDRQSANHGGSGQNVLFEDNHVEYLHHCRTDEATDNLFLSDRGYVEAGRHWNDAVIGNSWARPVLQRTATQ